MRELKLRKLLAYAEKNTSENAVMFVDDNGSGVSFEKDYQNEWFGVPPQRYDWSIDPANPGHFKQLRQGINLSIEEGYTKFAIFKRKSGRIRVAAITVVGSKQEMAKSHSEMKSYGVFGLPGRTFIEKPEK